MNQPTSLVSNPYASTIQTDAPTPPKRNALASGAIFFLGFMGLIGGFLFSMMCGFEVNVPESEQQILLFTDSVWVEWGVFAASILLAAVGAVLLCSQPVASHLAVVFVMCPIVAVAYFLGSPLRHFGKSHALVSGGYLVAGTALFGLGMKYLLFDEVAAAGAMLSSPLLIAGLACVLGAAMQFDGQPADGAA